MTGSTAAYGTWKVKFGDKNMQSRTGGAVSGLRDRVGDRTEDGTRCYVCRGLTRERMLEYGDARWEQGRTKLERVVNDGGREEAFRRRGEREVRGETERYRYVLYGVQCPCL